jgi:hypothetical protein
MIDRLEAIWPKETIHHEIYMGTLDITCCSVAARHLMYVRQHGLARNSYLISALWNFDQHEEESLGVLGQSLRWAKMIDLVKYK